MPPCSMYSREESMKEPCDRSGSSISTSNIWWILLGSLDSLAVANAVPQSAIVSTLT